jgi:hypothetical protein
VRAAEDRRLTVSAFLVIASSERRPRFGAAAVSVSGGTKRNRDDVAKPMRNIWKNCGKKTLRTFAKWVDLRPGF